MTKALLTRHNNMAERHNISSALPGRDETTMETLKYVSGYHVRKLMKRLSKNKSVDADEGHTGCGLRTLSSECLPSVSLSAI